jgi:glycosyltransferase involved in cell wall biosynthesis
VSGGTEGVVLEAAEGLTQAGHTVGLLEMATTPANRRLPNQVCLWTISPPAYPEISRPRSWLTFLTLVRQFQRVIRQFKPDILWVHFPTWQAIPLKAAGLLPHRWRLVITAHGSDIRSMPFLQPRLNPWIGNLFKQAAAVTAVSQSLLPDLLYHQPSVAAKAHVVHNGVGPTWLDQDAECPATNQNYILYAGRLHIVKGPDILLRAWKLIERETRGVELWLAGDGPEGDNLKNLTRSLGLNGTTRFLGAKTQEDLRTLYQQAKVVVFPSRNEGLPLSTLEACARGAISVGTKVGGIPEVIEDGISGFLVDPDSPEALAAGILRALRLSTDERQRISESARNTVEKRFQRSMMVDGYVQLFQKLIDR